MADTDDKTQGTENLSVMDTYRALKPIDFNMWNKEEEKTLFIVSN